METRNLEKALDIVSVLVAGEDVSERGANAALYQEYNTNPEVYDIVVMCLKKMNLSVYEYNNSLFAAPKEQHSAFGYSNEELRKELGLRLNKELYLVYFIIYNIIMEFYKDTLSTTYAEFVRAEDIIKKTDETTSGMIDRKTGFVLNEVEENSFRQIALSWDELPTVTADSAELRAARNSKSGFVKLTCNFLVSQKLLKENENRYYPTDRFKALIENYFDDSNHDYSKGRMAQLLGDEAKEDVYAADKQNQGE